MRWKRHTVLILVLVLAGCFTLAGILERRREATSSEAVVTFFDVGQGDAALVRTRGGQDLLIDGGPDESVLEGLADAMPWWDREIETVVVTHLDSDHYVGLFAVLRRYRIGEVLWSGVAPSTDSARRFAAALEERGIPRRAVKAGDTLAIGTLEFAVSYPFEDSEGMIVPPASSNAKGGGINDMSVVGRLSCGSEHALFTGDISAHVEAELLERGAPVAAKILKVGHHGSPHSSAEAFLDAVDPEEAILSSGARNRYGHPAPRVLAALADRGIRARRTDREGAIRYACASGRFVPLPAR